MYRFLSGLGHERPVLRERLTPLKQCRDIIDRKNVWMVQCARGLRFVLKTPESIHLLRERCRQNFDRHIAVQLLVARSLNLAHSTFADLRADFVAA
jgi:hypothetical protein